MTIGDKIYELRKNKGVSQETLAFDLNVSRQAVSKWETDQSIPDLDKIKALSEYFSVSIDYLVNNETYEQKNEKEESDNNLSVNLDKTNKCKRIARIMLKTVIVFHFVIILNYIIFTLLQNVFIGRSSIDNFQGIFVIPYISFIQTALTRGSVIIFSFYLLKKIKYNDNIVIDKIIFLILYYPISYFISYIFSIYLKTYISSFSSHYPIKYSYLMDLIGNVNNPISTISNVLFMLSLGILIVVSFIDNTKYNLPTKKTEYKTRDLLFSLFNGLLFGIYGLLFQIILLCDVKTDNIYRFKKMRFWYIIGLICSIPIVWVEIIYILSHIPFY